MVTTYTETDVTIELVGTVPMSLVLVLDVSGWMALVVVVMRMTWTTVFSITGVLICFVCYINTVSRLLIELFYYNVCYSGSFVRV